jgi:hypothetical protein
MATKDGLQLNPFHVELYFPKTTPAVSMAGCLQFFVSKTTQNVNGGNSELLHPVDDNISVLSNICIN